MRWQGPTASRMNAVWKFQYAMGRYGMCDMSFTSVAGHMMELEFSDPGVKHWEGCDPAVLFTAPVKKTVPEASLPPRPLLPVARRARRSVTVRVPRQRSGRQRRGHRLSRWLGRASPGPPRSPRALCRNSKTSRKLRRRLLWMTY